MVFSSQIQSNSASPGGGGRRQARQAGGGQRREKGKERPAEHGKVGAPPVEGR